MVRCHSRLGGIAFLWVGSKPVLLALRGSIVACQHPKQQCTVRIQWYIIVRLPGVHAGVGIFWVPELSTKNYYTVLNYQLGCHCDVGHPGSVMSFMELQCSKKMHFCSDSALVIVNGFGRGECYCSVLKTRYSSLLECIVPTSQMGYGSRALTLLQMYYEGKFPCLEEKTIQKPKEITTVSSEVWSSVHSLYFLWCLAVWFSL